MIEGGTFQFAPLLRYDYRVIAPSKWADKVMGKEWADLARLPWLATPPAFAHQRLLDSIFRPLGPIPKRVAYTDEAEAMIDFVESGICLSLARDSVLEQLLPHQRNFVIADRVAATCDLGFACLTGRRHEAAISHAFAAVQAVWEVKPVKAAMSAARSRKPDDVDGERVGILFGLARIEHRHQRARGEDQDAGAKSNSRFSRTAGGLR